MYSYVYFGIYGCMYRGLLEYIYINTYIHTNIFFYIFGWPNRREGRPR